MELEEEKDTIPSTSRFCAWLRNNAGGTQKLLVCFIVQFMEIFGITLMYIYLPLAGEHPYVWQYLFFRERTIIN